MDERKEREPVAYSGGRARSLRALRWFGRMEGRELGERERESPSFYNLGLKKKSLRREREKYSHNPQVTNEGKKNPIYI